MGNKQLHARTKSQSQSKSYTSSTYQKEDVELRQQREQEEEIRRTMRERKRERENSLLKEREKEHNTIINVEWDKIKILFDNFKKSPSNINNIENDVKKTLKDKEILKRIQDINESLGFYNSHITYYYGESHSHNAIFNQFIFKLYTSIGYDVQMNISASCTQYSSYITVITTIKKIEKESYNDTTV